MKFTITFKTPDAVDEAIRGIESVHDVAAAHQVCDKFFEYDEYVTIEIDTKKGTATVLPVRH